MSVSAPSGAPAAARRRYLLPTFLLLLPLLAATGVRLLPAGFAPYSVGLEAFTPIWLVSAAAAALLAAVGKRYAVAAATAALLATHSLLFQAPQPVAALPATSPAPSVAEERPASLTLVSANVLDRNRDTSTMARALRALDPDLVLLMEYNPSTRRGFDSDGILAQYPYSLVELDEGSNGIGLWSRYPLGDARVIRVDGRPMLQATVLFGEHPFFFVGVHPVAPVSGGEEKKWIRQLSAVAEVVRSSELPLVVAGDFNATTSQEPFQRILSAGDLRDAHAALGRWHVPTWPTNHDFLPPLLHLDHVLVSETIRPASSSEVDGLGSDHSMLFFSVDVGT